MIIQYDIVVTILDLVSNSTSKFNKTFSTEVTAATDSLLYNNYHIITKGVYILDLFNDEISAYCSALGISMASVEVDEFEISSTSTAYDVFFEPEEGQNELSLKPTIKVYIHPKNKELQVPTLKGVAYDSTTIIWTWPEDEEFAHYLVEESIDVNNDSDKNKIIAQLPIGVTSYTETGLEPNTPYTRRLINYTDEQTSIPSPSVTVITETEEIVQSLEEYEVVKNYDFTSDDNEREIIEENLEAFHSGIGDDNDLKVYKQMDADFYQKFKAYFEIVGKRTQREKRYEQVGFNYKICLEAIEEIEEQEGEVTFDIEAFPREWISIQDYLWATLPVTVGVKFKATVFLRKEGKDKEPEEIKVYKPKIEPVYRTEETTWSNPTAVIISVDHSSSMAQDVGGSARYKKTRKAVVKLIEEIYNRAKAQFDATGTTMPPKLIQWIIVKWATNASTLYKGYEYDKAKSAAEKMTYDSGTDGYTNWYKGLVYGKDLVDKDRQVVGQIFFTDGFPNVKEGISTYAYHSGMSNWSNIVKSISEGHNETVAAGIETYFVFGNGVNYVDTHYKFPKLAIESAKRDIVPEVQSVFGDNCYYPDDDKAMDNISENELAQTLIKGISIFGSSTKEVFDHYEVTGWDDDNSYTDKVVKYDIDYYKTVNVESKVYTYEFNNDKTPVTYNRLEKRAVILSKNMLPQTVLVSDLYNTILELAKQTPEWADGYNKTIGTIETGGSPDKYLIKGLFIQDTYQYADENNITDNDWDMSVYEDGLEGSINAYADIDKAGTNTYGDDCYLVSTDSKIYIQGYTDAIIYDYELFRSAELNAYDHKSEILISAGTNHNNLLVNRKNNSINYHTQGGSGPLNHVIDILQRDKDIMLTGVNIFEKGQYQEFAPLTADIIASIEAFYESPILNYRFNLEDPDAKTPIYEILPACNPMSDYLHVVLLHVYYAKNVWITNQDNYVAEYGDGPIPEGRHVGYINTGVFNNSTGYYEMAEGIYQWTQKEWKKQKDNGWYIDDYLWFIAKHMTKTREYYDELPGEGMESFYGSVNGRYATDNQSGKKDLRVDSQKFNIPTTITDKHSDSIRIYAIVMESYPDTALVSYKWEHPWTNSETGSIKDNITQKNGDYIYFSSDTLTYKDISYEDVITTINKENQEIFDNKTTEVLYEIEKPNTVYEYSNYYLSVTTDNSDVLAMRYPTEIEFDENGICNIGVSYKGVINATSKWSPRIHNGYYYLNQHEYFAYSEFDVEADFDTFEEINYNTAIGYISIDVQLRHKAKPTKYYSIIKDTRSELLQNEKDFMWNNGKGLTIRPFVDGECYKEYGAVWYISPVILFDNKLTMTGKFKIDYGYLNEFGETVMPPISVPTEAPLQIRYFNLEEGKWTEWTDFVNNTTPTFLSSGYQLRLYLQPSVTYTDKYIEDYLCCYLDWKDDADQNNLTNIVTITDHMTTGPDDAKGIYISRIFDYGCETDIQLDIFESNYKEKIQIFVAYTNNNPDILLLENIRWIPITATNPDEIYTARYFRYKAEIPSGEKMYWLHKRIMTKETHATLPYITSVSMTGEYTPTDIVTNFVNVEAFEIKKDGKPHIIFDKLIDVIGSDVIQRGYTEDEIEYVKILCTSSNVDIEYDKNVEKQYPKSALNTSITAITDLDTEIVIKNTPYIFIHKDEIGEHNFIEITGTPQQYCPITVEDTAGNTYIELFDTDSFVQHDEYPITEPTKYIEIKTNRYDSHYFKLYIDGDEVANDLYNIVNHLIIFNDFIEAGKTITIEYCIEYSFISVIDRKNNKTTLYLHTHHDEEGNIVDVPEKCKVYFETSTKNNKFIANDLSLNPIYRTDYSGFIYLTDEHNEPYYLNIYCNPLRLQAGGYDKVDIQVEVLDIHDNPVISKRVDIDCDYGILNYDEDKKETDMNGIIHLVYESSYKPCTATITAKVLTDDNTLIEKTIQIVNE